MSIIRRKRTRTIVVGLVAALVVAGGAIAYWTTSGTGSGTASVGTDSGVTFGGIAFASTLYPGSSTNVTFSITNTSANTPVQIGQVVADTAAGTNGITGLPVGCSAADFSFANLTVNQSIPASGTIGPLTGVLSFANTASNQDACKNAAPVLHLKVA